MSRAGGQTAAELLDVDVADLVATALRTTDPGRHLLITAATPAALRAVRAGVRPRSLRFLAEIVRRGGIEVAAGLPEPLPTPEQTELIRPWLAVAHGDDEVFARWLDGVAAIMEADPGNGAHVTNLPGFSAAGGNQSTVTVQVTALESPRE